MSGPEVRPHIESEQMERQRIIRPKTRVFFAVARASIGLAIIIYLSKSGTIDWRALSKLFTQWPITVAAVALTLLDVALIALRLCWLFRPLGLRLPFYNSMQLTLVGFFFGTFLPGAAGGDVARIFYAAKENTGRRAEIITVLIFDRAIGLFSLAILPLLFAPLFPDLFRTLPVMRILLVTFGLLTGGMLCIFVIFVFSPFLVDCCARLGGGFFERVSGRGRVLGTFFGTVPGRIHETMAAYRQTRRTLAAALGLSVIANLSLVGVTALGVLALNPVSWATKMFVLIPMGHVVNSLPLTPGGLGVGEAAFNALFQAAGLRGGADALLCWRIWKAIVSLAGLAVYLRGFKLTIFNNAPIQSNRNPHTATEPRSERCETP